MKIKQKNKWKTSIFLALFMSSLFITINTTLIDKYNSNVGDVRAKSENLLTDLKLSASEISLKTPANTSYYSPMEGYYPGTFSFENDVPGSDPYGWSVKEPGLQNIQVVSEIGNHKNVLELFDTESGVSDNAVANNSFSAQTSGTIELWYRTSGIQEYCKVRTWNDTGIVFGIEFASNSGNFEYNNGSDWFIIHPCENDRWYHLKFIFNCVTDTYDIYIDSVLIKKSAEFFSDIEAIGTLTFHTRQVGSSSDYYQYIDAIGYSWDPNYDIGDNFKEGLLVSYTNSTNLDWQGYSLDGQPNVTIYGNTTIKMPDAGTHTIQVFGNNTGGSEYASYINTFTIAGIKLLTPENKTYFGPDAGYYPATYGFEADKMGELPSYFFDMSGPSCLGSIQPYLAGHYDVLELYDGLNGAAWSINQNFSQTYGKQEYGTVEFWMRTNNTAQAHQFHLRDGSVVSGPQIAIQDDEFQYFAPGDIWTTIAIAQDNTWYHIRIDFESGINLYEGLATDTYCVHINGIKYGPYPYYSNPGNISMVYLRSSSASTGHYGYIDALSYSWDPNYNIGDNLREGLLLSYDNNTNLDWQGYSFDGQSNVTIYGNTTLKMPSDGTYSIQVFANDSSTGKYYQSDLRYFSVEDSYITLLTPENKTYYESDAGYYPATYGFENDPINTHPHDWIISGSYDAVIISEKNGHRNILELQDSGSMNQRADNVFTEVQDNGTIELWMYLEDATESSAVYITDATIVQNSFSFRIEGDQFWWDDGSWHVISGPTPKDMTWHHIRFHFETTTGNYQSLSQWRWKVEIDGVEYGDYTFYSSNIKPEGIRLYSGLSTTDNKYFDAVAYSWDPNYNIGDNLNEGLLLSYTNSTTLGWQGYSLDGQPNVTIYGNTTIKMPNIGGHTIQVFGNDSLGKVYASEEIQFTIGCNPPDGKTYHPIYPGFNKILDLTGSSEGLYIQYSVSELGYIWVAKQAINFIGVGIWSDMIGHAFYSFLIYNFSYQEDESILNQITIRFYYDENQIEDEDNIRILHYVWDLGDLIWLWEDTNRIINTEENYIQITVSDLSYFCLCELDVGGRDKKKDEGEAIWLFTEFGLFIIILAAVGVTIPTGYIVSKQKKKAKKQQKQAPSYTELESIAAQKRELLEKRMWKPEDLELKEKPEKSQLKSIPGTSQPTPVQFTEPKKKKTVEQKPLQPLSKEEIEETKKTEAEMDIQNKIDVCTVHKGKIMGFSYICPKCQAKYCLNCANTLKDNDEGCWVCETKIASEESDEDSFKKSDAKDYIDNSYFIDILKGKNGSDHYHALRDFDVTLLSNEFWDVLNSLEWDENEKKEFLFEMIALTPEERKNLIDDMLNNQKYKKKSDKKEE